jgi:hypothetical protein
MVPASPTEQTRTEAHRHTAAATILPVAVRTSATGAKLAARILASAAKASAIQYS